MKFISFFTSAAFIILFGVVLSCKKSPVSGGDCFAASATTRLITNKPAMVILENNRFYIVEQGTIDTKLYPCNLGQDFKADKLGVTISGEVKGTAVGGTSPCCVENFVVTKISK